MENFPVACIGVISKEDQVLMVQEGKDEAENQWAIPGGGLEKAEKLEECVKREMKEETGLETEVGRLIGTYIMEGDGTDRKMFVFAFECAAEQKDAEPTATDSVKDAKFVGIKKLDEHDLRFEQSKQIIQDSENQQQNKSLKYL